MGETKGESEAGVTGDTSNLLERILARDNMLKAMRRVIANKGSHGVDGMGVDELRPYVIEHLPTIRQKLMEVIVVSPWYASHPPFEIT